MLTTVARETGQDVFALMEQPLWRALWVFHHLGDLDARKHAQQRVARADMGLLVGLAFNEPSRLGDEMRDAQDAAANLDRAAANTPDILTRARSLVERVAAGKVLSPEALAS